MAMLKGWGRKEWSSDRSQASPNSARKFWSQLIIFFGLLSHLLDLHWGGSSPDLMIHSGGNRAFSSGQGSCLQGSCQSSLPDPVESAVQPVETEAVITLKLEEAVPDDLLMAFMVVFPFLRRIVCVHSWVFQYWSSSVESICRGSISWFHPTFSDPVTLYWCLCRDSTISIFLLLPRGLIIFKGVAPMISLANSCSITPLVFSL